MAISQQTFKGCGEAHHPAGQPGNGSVITPGVMGNSSGIKPS